MQHERRRLLTPHAAAAQEAAGGEVTKEEKFADVGAREVRQAPPCVRIARSALLEASQQTKAAC